MGWRKWVGVLVSVLLSVGLFGTLVQAETRLASGAGTASVAAGARTSADFYLVIEGTKQGAIKGNRKDGGIWVQSFNHEVVSPRDAASGLPTGRRQHKPLVIVKEIDKSTPLLFRALVSNETLKKVQLGFADAEGDVAYTITLTNASIASVTQGVGANGAAYEEISLHYEKITWTWADGGVTAEDSWETTR